MSIVPTSRGTGNRAPSSTFRSSPGIPTTSPEGAGHHPDRLCDPCSNTCPSSELSSPPALAEPLLGRGTQSGDRIQSLGCEPVAIHHSYGEAQSFPARSRREPSLAEQLARFPETQDAQGPDAIKWAMSYLLKSPPLFRQIVDDLNPIHFLGLPGFSSVVQIAIDIYRQSGAFPTVEAISAEASRRFQLFSRDPLQTDPDLARFFEDGIPRRIQETETPAESQSYAIGIFRQFLIEQECVQSLRRAVSQQGNGYRADLFEITAKVESRRRDINAKYSGEGQRRRFYPMEELARRRQTIDWLVPGLLVRNQPMVIAGPSKSMKTSIVLDLIASLSCGYSRPFLNRWNAHYGQNVLLISAESGESVIVETLNRICIAKGLTSIEELSLRICFDSFRLQNTEDLALIQREIRASNATVVVIDPLYLMLLAGGKDVNASNIYEMGPLMEKMSRSCLDAGATPILLHHFNKAGSCDFESPKLENMSFAGITEFARQWILLKRRERFQPGTHRLWMSTGGSAGHAGEWAVDIDEGSSGPDRERHWRVQAMTSIDAAAAYRDQRRVARDEAARDADEELNQRLLGLPALAEGLSESQIRIQLGANLGRVRRSLERLVASNRLVSCQVPANNGRTYPGYRIANSSASSGQ